MFSIAEILERILLSLKERTAEPVALVDALGRVAANDVRSSFTLPPIDICSVDGYAIRAEDVMQMPTVLRRIGKSRPGKLFEGKIGAGEAVHVLSGTPVPNGADTVIPEKQATKEGADITLQEYPIAGGNISTAGIDVSEGEVILKKGTVITSRHIGLAAAVKVSWLPVSRSPRIGVLVSAEEASADAALAENSISISGAISIALSSFISARGGIPVNLGGAVTLSAPVEHIVAFKSQVQSALEGMDMLVTAGGINDLEHNLMWMTLSEGEAVLEKMDVGIGRGESIIVGYQGTTPIIGFPGNPVSSLICASLFLRPAIDHMLGVPVFNQSKHFALLSRNLDHIDQQADYLYATLKRNENEELIVTPFSAQDTLMISVLASADCLVIVDRNSPLTAGSTVEILPFTGSITST